MDDYDPDVVIPQTSPPLLPSNLTHNGASLWSRLFQGSMDNPQTGKSSIFSHDSDSKDTDALDSHPTSVKVGSDEVVEHEPSSPQNSSGMSANTSAIYHENFAYISTLAPRRERKRLGLPLSVFSHTRAQCITACPDSGSDDNIMSRQIAEQLALPIMDIKDTAPPTFILANGRTVSAIGQVRAQCAFRQGSPAIALIDCAFYVFQTLAVPMIMGIEFLKTTETLTKYRNRLIEDIVPWMRALRVCSVGRPKRDVVCRVGNYVGCATADTGSDLDLVSPEFAASRAFDVDDMCAELEFADGSTGYTIGIIKAPFSIGLVSDVEGFVPRSKEVSLELFILENLNADILMGADTIEHLQAFSSHEDCFIPAIPHLGQSDLNIIRYIGSVERWGSKAWEFLKDSFASSNKKQAATTNQDNKRKPFHNDQLLRDQLNNRKSVHPVVSTAREHPPRPDNLQRHADVHDEDKHKDDALLIRALDRQLPGFF